MKELLNHKKVILFGTGLVSNRLERYIYDLYELEVDYFLDNDLLKQNKINVFNAKKVLDEKKGEFLIFIATSFNKEVKNQLILMGLEENKDFIDGYNFMNQMPRLSYSQCGEDLIIENYFLLKNIKKPNYLEIGAFDPKYLSNTYNFYLKGSEGVCIDANPDFMDYFKKVRKRDIVLNIGIGPEEGELDFYRFYESELNTFCENQVKSYKECDLKFKDIIKIPVFNINSVLEDYFIENRVNILSIDVEGLDLEILQSINFTKFEIDLICVETARYVDGKRNSKFDEFLMGNGYYKYYETLYNTIYILNKEG